mmetsp:Transcript_27749/g.24539  ORF Transcript_27749/g.24539 Transcript_27749/m.24539 type:complete len:159 (+) Transcript_27749:745-1221(+)
MKFSLRKSKFSKGRKSKSPLLREKSLEVSEAQVLKTEEVEVNYLLPEPRGKTPIYKRKHILSKHKLVRRENRNDTFRIDNKYKTTPKMVSSKANKSVNYHLSKLQPKLRRLARKKIKLIKNEKILSKTCRRLASLRHIKVVTNHMFRIAKLTTSMINN